jgi:NAD(P)-dependent dehydrogenase (short-subunit alcohol dehydrogenase family)
MAIERRTAVVTGASRGIGRAIAIAFAHQQYAVWALEQINPMGRLVRPEEVAELCVFLASKAAAAVTGAAYPVDAGETL